MSKISFLILFLLVSAGSFGQTTIRGIVTDTKENPIIGANIYLDGSYDGSSSDDQGQFSFTTDLTGLQTLVISYIAFETQNLSLDVLHMHNLKIKLRDDINSLGTVMLNSSTFTAGDNSTTTALKPLDIVTTAGAAGDIIGAFQTLPGTSTNAEDGRLFVRGGDANESNIYIDGLRVFQPFLATSNGIPTRGRFSPFLFDGISFSTGGYSAEYGDALSSVLLLNTTGEATKEKTDLQFLSVGLGGSHTKKWKKSSLSANAFYINLAPYQEIIKQNITWKKPYESLSSELVYRRQFKKGLLKVYGAYSNTDFALIQPDINTQGTHFDLINRNTYSNISYKGDLGRDWTLSTGASIANDKNTIGIDDIKIRDEVTSGHLKLKVRKRFSNRIKLHFGVEQFLNNFRENVILTEDLNFRNDYIHNNNAAFAESELFFSKNLALKAGIRAIHNHLLDESHVAPRISLALKTGAKSQLSASYGDFYQTPNQDVLKFDTSITQQKATHYILNYSYQYDGRTLRIEGYHKNYTRLLKYNTQRPAFDSQYNNTGFGEASGLDFFWRDNQSIKNLEYWASYSYLDTQRNHQNFPETATPNFATTHNLSLVTKYWIENWRSQMGLTYTFASGRPYNNPNTASFQNQKTQNFQNLSFNWAYLMSAQKILFLSITNVPNFSNTFGYQYANTPNADGIFDHRAITPNANRFIILGFFWTLSKDKKENQLNTL